MTRQAFDPSKFRKAITKSITGMSAGFNDPKTWIDTGNYVLNYLISGDFNKGVPLGKVSVFAGESGCLPATAKVRIRSKVDPTVITTITVDELREFYLSDARDKFEIATPDGYCDIINWYDKGELSMTRIATASYRTTCATNHLIQKASGEWCPALKLRVGDMIKTESGDQNVIKIEKKEPMQCYDFEIDHPNHRYWGDGISSHNSGKSYVCSGNIVRDAQRQGIFVVLIDSENALDKSWLESLGVDTSDDKLLKLNMAMIDDVGKTISVFMKEYKEIEPENREPVLFVIDSLGMLLSPSEVGQFESGDMKGDMGRKAKALKALVTNCVNMFGEYDIGMVATNHTYAAQGMYPTETQVVSGGSGFVFASSILVILSKLKLREDEDGNKTTDVRGIRAGCKVVKTRYNKPFETVEVMIPYESGMDRYSGLFDFFIKKGLLIKSGKQWEYTDLDGNFHKHYRKSWTNDKLDMIMEEFHEKHKQYLLNKEMNPVPPTELEYTEEENDNE